MHAYMLTCSASDFILLGRVSSIRSLKDANTVASLRLFQLSTTRCEK